MPRPSHASDPTLRTENAGQPHGPAHWGCLVSTSPTAGTEEVRVFGLSARERLARSFTALGLEWLPASELDDTGAGRVVVVSADHFYDGRLLEALARLEEDLLLVAEEPARGPVAVALVASTSNARTWIDLVGQNPWADGRQSAPPDLRIVSPTDLVPAHDAKLRKHSPPFVLPVDPDVVRKAEIQIFEASYKGVTDLVTKWIWPRPARLVTGWCVRRGISANAVTAASYVLVFAALIAFATGTFELGLVAAWLMTFLDTVDGKLARVTLTSSRLGDYLDHGLDLVHPPLWWAAWGVGLSQAGELFGPFWPWVTMVVVGYVMGRLLEGVFILAFRQEMFTWRPFDTVFRLVVARRNPNLLLLSGATLLGRPDLGLIAIALWTVLSAGIQAVRVVQAAMLRFRGGTIQPHSGVGEPS